MAGKTRIDGTTYSIKGGKTLINGTAYSIKQGKTRIDGTTYSITFNTNKTVVISGTATGSSYYAYAAINSTAQKDGTYTIKSTDELLAVVYGTQSTYNQYCRVYLNDTLVKSGSGVYEVDTSAYTNITIKFEAKNYNTYYWCYITAT